METQVDVAVKLRLQNFPAVETDLPTDTTVLEIREIVRKELSSSGKNCPVFPFFQFFHFFRGKSLPEST